MKRLSKEKFLIPIRCGGKKLELKISLYEIDFDPP